MSCAWIGSLALRTYPPCFRSARGDEMLGTLLDAQEDSSRAFVRGLLSLVLGGLRERARVNARFGARRLIADGFCQATVLWTAALLVTYLDRQWNVTSAALCAGVVGFALVGRDRIAGLCGIALSAYIAIHGFHLMGSGNGPVPIGPPNRVLLFLGRWLGPVIGFIVMLVKPRVRPHELRRLAWLVPIAMLAFAPELVIGALFLLCLPVLGVVVLPIDPRIAIAAAVIWADLLAVPTASSVSLGLVTLPILALTMLLAVAQVKTTRRGMPA